MKRWIQIGVSLVLGFSALTAQESSSRMAAAPSPRLLAEGNAAFAIDLYGRLNGDAANLFFSPYSISTALAMTALGAREQTATEMHAALHVPPILASPNRLAQAFGMLQQQLQQGAEKKGYELNIANALWTQKGHTFDQTFLTLNTKFMRGSATALDFGQSEAARKTINDWVEKQTRDKIKDLLPQGSVSGDTRLILTNAIYFKGKWADEFEKDNTRDEIFYAGLDGRTQAKAPLMSRSGKYGYVHSKGLPQDKPLPDFQIVALPYKGMDLSMVVLLPKDRDGLPKLERILQPQNLALWLAQLRPCEVQVYLPRFRIEGQTVSLKQQLTALGMKAAFVADQADFSGIDGTRELFIQDVVHKAFVDVNEEGTEAAAATGVIVGVTSVQIPEEPAVFRADHPFLFLIRENRNGNLLFMGRVVKP